MTFTWPDTLIEIGTVCLLALLVRGLLKRLIRRSIKAAAQRAENRAMNLSGRAAAVIARAGGLDPTRQAHRTLTVGSMLSSLMDAVVVIVVVFMVLQALGVNIMPALASVGIGGLAIGFGAQSLVKDIISGIFLMVEDQLGVGDTVDIGGLSGTVQALGLRATRLQDMSGEIWYVRNGEIATLGNRSQGWSTGTVHIPVSLAADPRTVITTLAAVCNELEADTEWAEQMLEPPTVLGLTSFEPTSAIYSVSVKCPVNKQWAVEREIRARAVSAFRDAGIQVPAQVIDTRAPADKD